MGSRATGIRTSSHMGSWRVQGEDFNRYAIMSGPLLLHVLQPVVTFFFKIYFYYVFIGKADIQRGETERKIFHPMIHSPSERNSQCYAGPKPGASSGSPTQVQGPKALGRPQLLSPATGRELEGKRGCRD